MKILNFGSCNIDYVYSLDHIVAVGETETTHKMEIFPGGKGLNQSIAASRAGAQVYHAGCVGNDGKMLTDILEESNVDITYIKKTDEKNGHAVIQVNAEGNNSIFIYPGSNEKVSKEFIDDVLENFSPGDIILLQNEISNVDYIIKKAYRKQMFIVLNPSPINEKITGIDFNMLSCIIVNEIEAKEISGCDSPEESLMRLKTEYPHLKIIMTLGEKGCVYADDSVEIRQSAFNVKAVDTTAAGDTFTGYFVAGISENNDIAEILKIASAASAIAVSKPGAAPSIPYKEEVLTAIKTLKPNGGGNKDELLKSQIENYIQQNLKTANSSDLSEILGYSAVYTGTLVKRLTGKTFLGLLQSIRCRTAAEMLEHTDMSVSEIINTAGYENESFFRKIFKEKYGKNPYEYRKTTKRR